MPWHVFVALVVLAASAVGCGQPAEETITERVARLVRQLGHDEFRKREAASKELDNIGEPALEGLRKAASADDAEVPRRAELLVQTITGRRRAAVTKKELEKLQGAWFLTYYETNGRQVSGENKGHTFTIKGDKWSTHVGGQLYNAGTVTSIEVNGKYNTIDCLITEGYNVGVTNPSIYTFDGNILKCAYRAGLRPTEFATKPGDGRHQTTWRLTKPVGPPDADSRW